jgi:RNA polymerase sigma factor (sigma-70 family)
MIATISQSEKTEVIPHHRDDAKVIRTSSLFHSSFADSRAARLYSPEQILQETSEQTTSYLSDETTQTCGKCMHYAAYRAERARSQSEREYWKRAYFALRNRIVMGHQKLIFKAVRYRKSWIPGSEELTADGHLVLLHVVSRYDPWRGVRFSTYAFTCLVRAFVRITKRQLTVHSFLSVGAQDSRYHALAGENREPVRDSPIDFEHYLQPTHPLLSEREKLVLRLRFGFRSTHEPMKLGEIGAKLRLSKERVRQVQVAALSKLRAAVSD